MTGVVDEVAIVRSEDGTLRLEADDPPDLVSFSPELLDLLRRGGSVWATIDGDTVSMAVQPTALYYRLTGETDLTGGYVGQRVTEDGRIW